MMPTEDKVELKEKPVILEAVAGFAAEYAFYPIFQSEEVFQAEGSNGKFTVKLTQDPPGYIIEASSSKIQEAVRKAIIEVADVPVVPTEEEGGADVQQPPSKTSGKSLIITSLKKLLDLFDSDVFEIFGDTGNGKTIFCQAISEEAVQAGASVVYIDTEKNVGRKAKARLSRLKGYKELKFNSTDGIKSQLGGPGFYYLYTPKLSELSTITRNLPDADLVIIDSLGMPVLVKYSRMKQNEQGHVLQEMIAIKGDLKEWAYRSNGLAIDINQPVSDMNKTPQQIKEGLYPFGDKSGFATKSVLRFWKLKDEEGMTLVEGKIHKSRDFGRNTKIIDMKITNDGVEISILEAA